MFLSAKDPYEAKYQLLINKRESTSLKYFNDSKFSLNTQMIWTIFKKLLKNTNIIEYQIKYYILQNTNKIILIVFDDITADMLSNKKLFKQ